MTPDKTYSALQDDKIYLTDGGLETVLIFEEKFDLPEFAAFTLLNREKGFQALKNYYLPYIRIAKEHRAGFVLESPTYRASRSWGERLGYTGEDLDQINRTAIAMLDDLRMEFGDRSTPMMISGCIGPKGDGYRASGVLSVAGAKAYHLDQILSFREARADMVSAFTMNDIEEAAGIALAAKSADMPVVISFTTETDGRLPSGDSLKAAVEQVDNISGRYPLYYMINCAHPTHFADVLTHGDWSRRIGGIRANASCKSHEELDDSDTLDAGDKTELAEHYRHLTHRLPGLKVLGGCCGTDHDHIGRIAQAVFHHGR